MRLPAFIFALFAAAVSFGAEYSIPSGRLPASGTWAAAGVPGGIPERTTVYTTINTTGDSTDRTAEINAALAACPNGEIVKLGAGTFVCSSAISIGYNDNGVELRGTLNSDGTLATIIDGRSTSGITLGTYAEFNYPSVSATVASLTKGATVLTVSSSADFTNGQLAVVEIANEADTPVFSVFGYSNRRAQVVKLLDSGGKPSGTTIAIESPGLHGDFSGASSATIRGASLKTTNSGLRDLRITGENSSDVMIFGINMENGYGCYVYNVKSDGATSTPIRIAQSLNCELRRFWSGATDGSTSAYGILSEYYTTSLLVIDSVVADSAFGIEQQIVTSGNVYAYNAIINSQPSAYTSTMNVNHGPWSQFTLLEGNVGSVYQNDGYFGGTGYTTVFRNWFMGASLASGTSYYSVALNRYSRNENMIGNVLGRTGIGGGGPYSMGNPNIGNGNSYGASSMRGAASTLTTRTNATSGTITAPSGHGITTGSTIDVYWAYLYDTNARTSHIRRSVTVGTVSGTSIPFSGGSGDDLPAQDEVVYVPTSNTAIITYPLDWDAGNGRIKQWPGVLTTRTDGQNGVITLDTGLGSDFSAALAEAFPANYRTLMNSTMDGNLINFIGVASVVGDVVTINYGSTDLPAESTAVNIVPGPAGFQYQDLDVIYTLLAKGNYWGLSSGSGIPSSESLGGDTLANSLFLSSEPQFFTDAGITWPPIDPASPVTNTYELIPAGQAYNDGWWPSSGGGGSSATVTNTTTVTGTLAFP